MDAMEGALGIVQGMVRRREEGGSVPPLYLMTHATQDAIAGPKEHEHGGTN